MNAEQRQAEQHLVAGRLRYAAWEYRAALQRSPNDPAALLGLGATYAHQGRVDDGIRCFRHAAQVTSASEIWRNLLYLLWFSPNETRQSILAEHARWAATLDVPEMTDWDAGGSSRLRIGYVSPDLRSHVVGRFVGELLAAHQFETFCYFNGQHDATSVRLRALSDHWIDTHTLDDAALAARIRADRIDVLVDLSLHMAGSRLSVFARKPAPVQCTYVGYPATTGLSQIDYRIADPHLEPLDRADGWLGPERVARLPECYWAYPPPDVPVPLRWREGRHIRFGCLNNIAKVNPPLVDLWIQIMHRVPGSRLRLLVRGGAANVPHVLSRFNAAGIGSDRIDLLDRMDHPTYMARYNDIDIALDTFPYSGGTTTLDATYMGVPLVTLVGDLPASRMSLSVMRNVGPNDLATFTPSDYVETAVALACNRPKLAHLRRNLQGIFKASPLMDRTRFTRSMEALYREMLLARTHMPNT